MRTATQTQLAKHLGISRSTVAAALNPNSTVRLSEATRKLVAEAAARLNYRPNQPARLMRGMKSGLIGIFHFGGLSQVAAERAWHASRHIEAAGYKILSYDLSWSPEGARTACDTMLDAKVEGLLIAGLNDPGSIIELKTLRERGLPMVTLSGNELKGVPHIRGDASRALREMTQHLLGLGRKKLLFVTHHSSTIGPGTYVWASTERLKGFKAALHAAGADLVEKFTRASGGQGRVIMSDRPLEGFDPYHHCRNITSSVLQEETPPDAVICGNDDWAIGAMSAVRAAGLRVPEDIAVTGYDNTSQGQYLDVPLTTVAQPSEAMAECSVNMLLASIKKKRKQAFPALTEFPCELIIRASCGAKKAQRSDLIRRSGLE